MGLAETQQALVSEGLRSRARVRVDGGFKTGRDVVVAALLGADEYSFGTALLLAEGCLMVRSCHLDTCPVGIATQDPKLREKFAATPEQVEAYILFVAEEVRRTLASLGLRSLDEAIGRTELLRQREVENPRAMRTPARTATTAMTTRMITTIHGPLMVELPRGGPTVRARLPTEAGTEGSGWRLRDRVTSNLLR